LDAARAMAQEDLFAIGMRVLSGALDPVDAGPAFSALAETLASQTLTRVLADFESEYGCVKDGRIAVIAMGKLGSREMTATSDLDLVIIYDYDEQLPESDGRRPLHATAYYTRLTQRFISALTVSTRRGALYEVDMRLRPSGKKGPLAVQLSAFRDYQAREAEIWEHMALTRARPLCGDQTLMDALREDIARTLARPRKRNEVAQAIRDMRALIATEKGDDDIDDVKTLAGGLIDVEFLAQFFALTFGDKNAGEPGETPPAIFRRAVKARRLTAGDAEQLINAYRLYADVTQMQRVTLAAGVKPMDAPPAVRRRIAQGVGAPDDARLALAIRETAAATRALFDRILA
ncbi:MAG: bifunctional [glutamine synthetase] adenylyltransferase/[glutamine synthetase]-adenylyl-L-tyrosine phosphorylase, partial [Hyphomicrobiales bacterium]|nr:bifunctional [glutamine synthetase] adenylyltransferase/[glutamine synthetase]-adenylyl-L-tyrosine phosphorylase [Hyphomicrobiales bacterium]